MKTETLRAFIREHGPIEIGPVRLLTDPEKAEADIDVHVDGRLVGWASGSLEDMHGSTMHDWKHAFATEVTVEKEVEKVVEVPAKEDGVLRGKVEAYEKILLGRGLTITP